MTRWGFPKISFDLPFLDHFIFNFPMLSTSPSLECSESLYPMEMDATAPTRTHTTTTTPPPQRTQYMSVDVGFADMDVCLETVKAYLSAPQALDRSPPPGSYLTHSAGLVQRRWMQQLSTVLLDGFSVTQGVHNSILLHALLLFQRASPLPKAREINERVFCAACAHVALKFESQSHESLDDDGEERKGIIAAEMVLLSVMNFEVRPLHDYATPLFTILNVPEDIVDTYALIQKEMLFYPFIWYGKSNTLMTCATLLVATMMYCNSEIVGGNMDILSCDLFNYIRSGCDSKVSTLLELHVLPLGYMQIMGDLFCKPPPPPQCEMFVEEILKLETCRSLVPIIVLPRSYAYSFIHIGIVDDFDEVVGMAQHIMSSLYIQYS